MGDQSNKGMLGVKYDYMDARNKQLHKTERLIELEGKGILIKAIHVEYAIGLSRLPAHSFPWMFQRKQEELTKESNDTMRN